MSIGSDRMKKMKTLIKSKPFKLLLEKRNLSYTAIAENIHVDRTVISNLANRKRYVSGYMRELLIDYLKVDFDDIFEIVEIDYVNNFKPVPEVELSKDEIYKLLKAGSKEIMFKQQKIKLKVAE
ncbi:helix-turn-helix domain-containing protein [Staphylococcus hominis]|uniref:helix-turn-helix domain-containing protein n=1 Tax=Staphylococcus hominis TaxID=1290 RepID=UPI00265C3480|nr:helix-turn-helix transcriptional regulator [Staphylococcus hominis]MDO0983698.1 helix-turn-helix transcriptional regulator [Staphylococcus hominis]